MAARLLSCTLAALHAPSYPANGDLTLCLPCYHTWLACALAGVNHVHPSIRHACTHALRLLTPWAAIAREKRQGQGQGERGGTDESMTDEVRVTVIATGFQENLHAKLPSAERRVAQQVAAGGGNRSASRPPTREMASGFDLSHDDYDIPTFFKHAD